MKDQIEKEVATDSESKKRVSPLAKVGKKRVLMIQKPSLKPSRSVGRVKSIIPARTTSKKVTTEENKA